MHVDSEMFERNLPPYLAHDLEAWKRGVEEKSRFLDCLWGEGRMTEPIDFAARFEALFGATAKRWQC